MWESQKGVLGRTMVPNQHLPLWNQTTNLGKWEIEHVEQLDYGQSEETTKQ